MSTQQRFRELDFQVRGKNHGVPVGRPIGFEAKEIGDGRSTIRLASGPHRTNPMGTLHGGILCDIADAEMGTAFASTLAPEESFATVELRVNFLRPVWKAQLKAGETAVQRGRTIGLVECNITDEKNLLVAKAASTCTVLRGEKAEGW